MNFNLKIFFRWFCMKNFNKEISSGAFELLNFIASNLVSLQNLLAAVLFQKILYEIIDETNLALLENVVLENSFNQFGALQLDFDISNGFISVFKLHMKKPEVHFVE